MKPMRIIQIILPLLSASGNKRLFYPKPETKDKVVSFTRLAISLIVAFLFCFVRNFPAVQDRYL